MQTAVGTRSRLAQLQQMMNSAFQINFKLIAVSPWIWVGSTESTSGDTLQVSHMIGKISMATERRLLLLNGSHGSRISVDPMRQFISLTTGTAVSRCITVDSAVRRWLRFPRTICYQDGTHHGYRNANCWLPTGSAVTYRLQTRSTCGCCCYVVVLQRQRPAD